MLWENMHWENLFDAVSAAIVVGGTALATLLRCGLDDSKASVSALRGAVGAMRRQRFDIERMRAELSTHIREIRQDGLIRAQSRHVGDAEIDDATDALIGTRSLEGLKVAYEAHQQRRAEASHRAVRTLAQGADLAPVFGLAGTLVSLSQLASAGGLDQDFRPAISMAVLTTLYGLLLGNLVLAPLSRLLARQAAREDEDRRELLDWLEEQVAVAIAGDAGTSAERVAARTPRPAGHRANPGRVPR